MKIGICRTQKRHIKLFSTAAQPPASLPGIYSMEGARRVEEYNKAAAERQKNRREDQMHDGQQPTDCYYEVMRQLVNLLQMDKSLQELYSFAFEPHYSKKYRAGDPNSNKRHQEKAVDFKKIHQVQVLLDPWIKLESLEEREASLNRIQHVAVTDEVLREREREAGVGKD